MATIYYNQATDTWDAYSTTTQTKQDAVEAYLQTNRIPYTNQNNVLIADDSDDPPNFTEL